MDQFILQRRILTTKEASTGPSAQPLDDTSANIIRDSPSLADAETGARSDKTSSGGDTKIVQITEELGEDVEKQENIKEKTVELDQDQAGSDPGETFESRPQPEQVHIEEDQARPEPGISCVALAGPDPELTHDEFMADLYPKVQESLNFLADEHVILEDPLSSTRTLSSMKNLEDAYAIRDQFINDKSTDDDSRKLNVEAEVVSMVTVPIYQASSSVPPLSTPVIDLKPPKLASSTTQTLIFTATTMTTTTPFPPPPQQQSTTESELAKHPPPPPPDSDQSKRRQHDAGTSSSSQPQAPQSSAWKKYHVSSSGGNSLLEKTRDMQTFMNCFCQKIGKTEFTQKVKLIKSLNLSTWMSFIFSFRWKSFIRCLQIRLTRLIQKVINKGSGQALPISKMKAARYHDFGLELLVPEHIASGASGSLQLPPSLSFKPVYSDKSKQHHRQPSGSFVYHLSPPDDQQLNDDSVPIDEEHSSGDTDLGTVLKANALASTYQALTENSLLEKTRDMWTFMNWYCQKVGKTKLTQADLKIKLKESRDQVRIDISRPLPLSGPPGHVTIQTQFFFNKDLDYLRYGSKGSGHALSISKMKAARYPEFGWDAKGFEYKRDYTIIESPRAVVFPVRNNERKITRFNKIYKFSDGTLTNILETLDYRVKEYKVNRLNPGQSSQDLEVQVKMEMEIPRSSGVHFITACSYSTDTSNDLITAEMSQAQDGERPQIDDQRLDLADDLKEAQDHISRSIISHKTKITTSKYKILQIIEISSDSLEDKKGASIATTPIFYGPSTQGLLDAYGYNTIEEYLSWNYFPSIDYENTDMETTTRKQIQDCIVDL
ncbi:hypothetical protein Tco_0939817 [Tanacetum coccineum]|uniref:Uncharacterized protein n=1 Tax=Tanacetum coccineum TaxID=301880 RepID=A0ABQ5DM18_9ASTR